MKMLDSVMTATVALAKTIFDHEFIPLHRLVYQVLEAEKAVKILRLWTHYE